MKEGQSAQGSRKEVEGAVAAKKVAAKRSAKKAGRKYPNLVDNMRAASKGKKQEIQNCEENEKVEEEVTMSDQLTLNHVADEMQGIDIAILSTHAADKRIACRPMSNNGDVKYDGTSFFFSYEQASCVADIERDPNVALGYSSKGHFRLGLHRRRGDGQACSRQGRV